MCGCGCNPCCCPETSTVECESLSSQIHNFTVQFFGDVVKTEINGVVTWSLPCSLDIGLQNNPRASDEGLACYFLRLFGEGIIGATGPPGESGAAGADGNNAFTVTLASFSQPSLGSPNVTISTLFNPAILEGSYVFIDTSGWFQVTAKDGSGTLFLTLVKPLDGAPATITSGKLVVPSGFPGSSVEGPAGPQGSTGPQGSPGVSHTETNDMYLASAGTDYNLGIAYAGIEFTSSSARVLLPTAGTYLISVTVDYQGLAGVLAADQIFFRLRNNETGLTVDGSEHISSQIAVNELRITSFTVLHTITGVPNQQITLQAKCTTVDVVKAIADRTTITYVKLQ